MNIYYVATSQEGMTCIRVATTPERYLESPSIRRKAGEGRGYDAYGAVRPGLVRDDRVRLR